MTGGDNDHVQSREPDATAGQPDQANLHPTALALETHARLGGGRFGGTMPSSGAEVSHGGE